MGASGSVRDRDARSVVIERLKRRSDFRSVASGVRTSGGAFVLQARSRGDEGAVRVGFTVSKQVGNAVERNRVRRRLREAVRLSAAGAPHMRPGHDYVLIGRRAALAAPFGEMVRELDSALRRVHAQIRAAPGGRASGARPDLLHEAGSPSRSPRAPQRSRNRKGQPASSQQLSPTSPAEPREYPPQER